MTTTTQPAPSSAPATCICGHSWTEHRMGCDGMCDPEPGTCQRIEHRQRCIEPGGALLGSEVPEYPDMEEIWLANMVHAEAHYEQGTHPDDCAGPDCRLNRYDH